MLNTYPYDWLSTVDVTNRKRDTFNHGKSLFTRVRNEHLFNKPYLWIFEPENYRQVYQVFYYCLHTAMNAIISTAYTGRNLCFIWHETQAAHHLMAVNNITEIVCSSASDNTGRSHFISRNHRNYSEGECMSDGCVNKFVTIQRKTRPMHPEVTRKLESLWENGQLGERND